MSACAPSAQHPALSSTGLRPLRVLIAHNRYQQAGGEDTVVAREAAMLTGQGHQVQLLHSDNKAISKPAARAQAALRSFYSLSAHARIRRELLAFQPDIVHVHNITPNLSPAVFFAANAARIPVVQTLHNYRLICANAELFRDGLPCEDCVSSNSFLPGIRHACYRDSRVGSAVVGAGMALHSALGTWTHRVDRFIALTDFAARKLSEHRIPLDRIRVKANFVPDRGAGDGQGGFALFAGRLSREKGLETLLAADRQGRLALPVHIAGDGPMLDQVRAACARPGSRLVALGRKSSFEMEALMKQASVLIVPSLWYEGFPLVMVEALAVGLPILASRIGGLPEIAEDTVSGLFYSPGHAAELAAALGLFAAQPQRAAAMRVAARRRYLDHYSEAINYRALLAVYSELLPAGRA